MPHRLRELQPRHHAAIRMRIEGRSTEQISRALEVKPRTLYIWFSEGEWFAILRLYRPRPEVIDATWECPPIELRT